MNKPWDSEIFREHWKFWLSILLAIMFFVTGLIVYMRHEEKRVELPKIVKYEDSTNPEALSKTIRVDSGTSREITRQIERIHDGDVRPVVTYTVEAPTIETAATEIAKSIEQKDTRLPKQAVEKTDRTVITPDPNKQTVDVYKINLRNNHKIKVGVLQADGKTYGGAGYQAGRWEGMVYTKDGRQIDAGSIMYTIKQW
ncbi:hypothetical protein [uncultured Megasphaera sp.]|uniref:hypothetical protein n=1 Tax=uncultured Megasphaera sp. TaxID=165188 RepID=UPI0025DCB477|nr:hypothetical protein [uncultured Megasphaera sp.]